VTGLKLFGFYQHITQICKYGYGYHEQDYHIFSKNFTDKKNSAKSTMPEIIKIAVSIIFV